MTNESPATHRKFVNKYDAQFALLTDRNSDYFRQLGIFNDELAPDHRFYGIPHPGIMLVDAAGQIVAKFAEADYRDRPALIDVIEAARTLAGDQDR